MGLFDDLKKNAVASVGDLPVLSTVTNIVSKTVEKSVAKSSKANAARTKEVRTPNKEVIQIAPTSVWEKIGCSPKTVEFIKMSLEDGMIDAKERAMLIRRVEEDGIDPQEFDFVLTKALENYQTMARNVIKELSALFAMADKMANNSVKPEKQSLTSQLPAIMAKKNPYLIGAIVATDALGAAITSFIKAPSKLNTFKAEIIRLIDIPLFPEVIVDFCGYVNSQILEERQRNSGKGIFAEWSEALFGKDIDLITIWNEKMRHVMTKAVMRYGNDPYIMGLLEKWRLSPLKKLMKITNPQQVENFPIPLNASDYIALVKYSYEKGESIKTPHREAYAQLNARLLKESSRFVNAHPSVRDVIYANKVRTVNIVMSNCDNPVFMVQFKTPKNLEDLLEVLHFFSTRKDLKKYHQRVYGDALRIFSADQDAISKIQQFRPKNILGF